ncbi:hypothetical protein ASPWEDRAFT_312960 [Aspergillus wentii DTO 134E9]|uniref:Uncharacterized protein n=1 Tax=Aspergillus wentii DTO 134E9 TaxID=1073089 RepID=A0A1L9RTD7_ASPWE|nr:uncharacterized protein ASPWEDRAFT_312960 [Aspergillus wentii DTO 134E9]OJJ38185.1 hypothetical protein ASPWEDRAFT_312960 [Aspergillus wentii DTO 134E9]
MSGLDSHHWFCLACAFSGLHVEHGHSSGHQGGGDVRSLFSPAIDCQRPLLGGGHIQARYHLLCSDITQLTWQAENEYWLAFLLIHRLLSFARSRMGCDDPEFLQRHVVLSPIPCRRFGSSRDGLVSGSEP